MDLRLPAPTRRTGLRNLLVSLLAVVLSLPALAAEMPDIDIPYERFVLPNGLRVIVHEDRKAPIVAVSIWYHVGSKNEPEGRTGFAHLFEHIMFEGSENYDDRFSKPLEQVGATSLNGTTWFDRTNYFENVPTPALELALFLESDRMGHLLGVLTQDKLDQERGVVQNEKRQGDNQPYGKVGYRVLEGLYPPGHPYRHNTIGSMEDLEAASLEDVHEWFKTYYGAANTVVVLAGDISPERGRELVAKYFGDIPPGPPLTRMQAMVPDRDTDTREVMVDRVPQIRSFQNWAVPGRTTRDRALLELAAYVLGDGKNSRLYQALIYETQHAVSLSVEVEPQELASIFTIDTTLRPGATLQEVDGIIAHELERFLARGPGEEELARARSKINASVIRGLEQVGGFGGKAGTLAEGELYDGNPAFYKTLLQWINEASPEDVREAAVTWLSDGRYQLDVMPDPAYAAAATGVDRSQGLPVVEDLPDLSFPEVQRGTLKNGINVVLAERHAVPVVSVSMQFDAGYAADADRTLGTAGFTLAMLDESTRNRSALEIDAEAERLGAEISSGSNLDMSTVSLSALKQNLAPSIELFADIVRNPAFAPEEMERQRVRRLAAIEQEKNSPVGIALRTLPPLIYGDDHAYGIPFTGSGTEESVASISRDDLTRFHRDWLRPDNATLFVVGDTSLDEVLPLLDSAFGDWKAPRSDLPRKHISDVELPAGPRLLVVDKPGSPQSLILAAHVAPPTGVDNNITIETMNDIIGGVYSARVNQNLRVDKGWSYGASTFLPDARGQRPFMVYAPVQTDRTGDSIRELVGEFERFQASEPAGREELTRVVRNNVYSLPGQYETNGAVLNALLANDRFGRPDDYVATLAGQYQAQSLEKVQGAAENVLHPERLTWVVVGDREQIMEQLRNLDLAPVEVMDSGGQIEDHP
ncbi:M16 family metallopeptidase [Elongatibacter sediminis]|uniref:Pitrilysin family protein n=1 Tax=Elongatibacter sediminis TaxID=3119006 RepID=A0AAW9RKX6_9GAMM